MDQDRDVELTARAGREDGWAADVEAAGAEAGTELGVADLAVDPRTDAEALCLCALLWSSTDTATRVVDVLAPEDFVTPAYGELFTLVGVQVRAGRPHDPASIASVITVGGGGHRAGVLGRALADATIAGADPETAGHYATAVAAAAYRRGYATAAAALTQAAAELPEADLFAHLLTIGRERRTALRRLEHLRSTLGG